MRKNSKLLSLALSACMVGSMLAGCSAKSDDDADTPSSSVETEAESTEEADDADADSESEKTTEEDTEGSEYGAEGTAAGEFIEQVMATKGMTSYTATSEIVINDVTDYNGDVDETEVTLGLVEMVDGNGNMSLTISVDYDDGDDTSIHGDLITISKIDDRIYLDMTGLYEPMVYLLMGSDMEEMEEYYESFGTTSEEAEALLVLSIPIGDLDLSETDYTALEDVMDLVADDLAASLDSLGEDFMTVDGDTYTFTVNNDNVIDIADAVLSALDGNMEAVYDAYVETVKASDYSEYLDSVINAVVNEFVEGLEEAAGEDMDDETLTEIEEYITGFIEAYETTVEENLATLEDDKQEFLDEFAAVLEEFDEGKDDAAKELADDEDNAVSAVATVTFSGEEGSRVIDSDMTFEISYYDETEYAEDELYDGSEAYSYYMSESVSVSIKTTIEEGDVTISAPESYATLADLAVFFYNLEEIYDEYVDYDTTVGYEYDDDYDYDYDTYTQAELCEIYGVTLEDGQVIACYTTDGDAVIITPYDGMEFYSPDDTSNMMMEFDENYDTYITIYVYDTSYDAEFYEDYYDAQMIEDNLYYYEYYEDMADLVYFGDNITIDIELDTYADGGLDEVTGGDTLDFMQSLLKLCEIVSPA